MAKKPNEKPTKPRKPPKPLEGAQLQQYKDLTADASDLLETINVSTIPAMHIRQFKRDFTAKLTSLLKSRKVDPKKRSKEKLEAKLADLNAKIAELS